MGIAIFRSSRGRAALPRAPLIAGLLAVFTANALAQTTPDLRARYMIPFASPTDNDMRPHFDIINSGTSTVPLTELTLRYWFTEDGTQAETFNCDWTARGCTNVTSKFVTLNPARPNADTYVEVGFTSGAGSLAPGQTFGEIQGRINKNDWTNYNEADDYSYDPTKTALTDWTRVTMYRNGVLIWGTEPQSATTPDFVLAAVPTGVTVAQGGTATSALSITRANGLTAAVSLASSGLPSGVTASFAPTSVTGAISSSTLTFAASATATQGTFTVTVTGSTGTITHSVAISLVVAAPAGFALSASPASVTVAQSQSAIASIAIARNAFTASIALSASGLPPGVTAAFNPATTTASASTLTFTAATTAATGAATVTVTATGGGITATTPISLTVSAAGTVNAYTQRFNDMWAAIHGNNGYLHSSGLPYHSVETLMVEAPDQGHETTSEAVSYLVWLEVMHGNITGDWAPLQKAFDTLEAFMIPTAADQPTNSFYNAAAPATYAPEADLPSGYPAVLDSGVPVGADPIASQLRATYGNSDMYGMHWILDVDNFYGYGRRGDGVSQPSYINTFQRGPQESTWETVPQPSWEDFKFGAGASGGYLPLFIAGTAPVQQWRYTDAPDADARLIQAMYWANVFAPTNATVVALSAKAAKMGDFLRYSFFDKYFKTMGCTSPQCPAGTGYNGAHFLLSWYYAWGGPIPPNSGWSFRIGASHVHFGYQNPMAAWALSNVPALEPKSSNAVADWTTSLGRQLEFYRWLQTSAGSIAGGATNSLGGRYLAPAAGVPTFYSMAYQENPVYLDPGSNTWFGFQVWSMERVAEFYYATNNAQAKLLLDKWVAWAMSQVHLLTTGGFEVPSNLALSGKPSMNWSATNQNWNAADTSFNAGLNVTAASWGQDLGVTAGLAKTLTYYSAGTKRWATQNTASQAMAKELLDRMWTLYRDPIGVSSPETRTDFSRFGDAIFVPSTFTGKMPNGDPITSASTFLSIRSKYLTDPAFPKVQAFLNGGAAPTFNYHRFWAQADVALANAEYGRLFP